jgi:hypothetical protein
MQNETEIAVESIRLCLTTERNDAARYEDGPQMQRYLRNSTGADIILEGDGVLRIGTTLYVHDYYLIGEGEER